MEMARECGKRLKRSPVAAAAMAMAGVLLTAGCQVENPTAAAPNPGTKPRKVQVAAAAQDMVPRGIEVTGTLAAQDEVQLAMKVPGRVAELLVDLGDPVRKGQQLARLDPADLEM